MHAAQGMTVRCLYAPNGEHVCGPWVRRYEMIRIMSASRDDNVIELAGGLQMMVQ